MKNCYANPTADQWYQQILKDPGKLPLYFTYNGTEYQGFSSEYFQEIQRNQMIP